MWKHTLFAYLYLHLNMQKGAQPLNSKFSKECVLQVAEQYDGTICTLPSFLSISAEIYFF